MQSYISYKSPRHHTRGAMRTASKDGRLLGQFHVQFPSNSNRGTLNRIKLYLVIIWIEEPIELRATSLHPSRHYPLCYPLLFHRLADLPHQHALDGVRGGILINTFLFQKISERRPNVSVLFHCSTSLRRLIAKSISARGVFPVFLINPCSKTIRSCATQKITREIRLLVSELRTSQSPRPSGRHTGIPIGQPNSTAAISYPIIRRSVAGSSFSHDLTGSAPFAER